jgi:hypothetical protein
MQRKFEPGEIFDSEEVEALLARTGQDAESTYPSAQAESDSDCYTVIDGFDHAPYTTIDMEVSIPAVEDSHNHSYPVLIANDEPTLTELPPVGIVEPPPSLGPDGGDFLSEADSVSDATGTAPTALAETGSDCCTVTDRCDGAPYTTAAVEDSHNDSYPVLIENDEPILTDR